MVPRDGIEPPTQGFSERPAPRHQMTQTVEVALFHRLGLVAD